MSLSGCCARRNRSARLPGDARSNRTARRTDECLQGSNARLFGRGVCGDWPTTGDWPTQARRSANSGDVVTISAEGLHYSVDRFPTRLRAIARGDLHLCALCALASQLTRENAAELFEACRGKKRRQIETANQLRPSRHARTLLACRCAPSGVRSGGRAVRLRLRRWQALSGARVYRVRSREAVCQTRLGRSAKTFGQGQLERATVPEPRPLPLKCAVA